MLGISPDIGVPWALEQEYVRQMPMVWVRQDRKHRTRFHRSPNCFQLTKGPARGEGLPLLVVDLEEVFVRPCKNCYPDAPRLTMRHPYCYTCESSHPCVHNGGVLIIDRGGRRFYVWPDTNQMPLYRRSA